MSHKSNIKTNPDACPLAKKCGGCQLQNMNYEEQLSYKMSKAIKLLGRFGGFKSEIKKDGDVFVIEGGGYGHGIGMSQNGANEMAKTGMNYKDILQFFYSGAKVE